MRSTVVVRRLARLVGFVLICLVAGGTASAATADDATPTPTSSAEPVTFGIAPASADSPDDRAYLVAGAAPGSVVYEHIAVINQSDVPLSLAVYPVSAGNTSDGSLGLAERGMTSDAGGWLTLGAEQVDVPAQSTDTGLGFVIVPVTITIPTDAEPGDHVAGIVASLTTTGQSSGNSPSLQLEQRTGVRVYITVAGDAAPALQITDVETSYDPGPLWGLLGQGSVHLSYTIVNPGNVRMAVEPSTTTAGPFGLLTQTVAGTEVAELAPNGRAQRETTLTGVWPLIHTGVTVTAVAGQAKGGSEITLDPATDVVGLWTIPWAWLAILLVAGLVGWWMRRRRRIRAARRGPAGGGRHSHARRSRRGSETPVADQTPVAEVAGAAAP
ncbi:MAG: hypothetical protein KJ548_03425 [Actinobacteria bacterium]|nr:hypothetical protein [Actinomycetota bacterium]